MSPNPPSEFERIGAERGDTGLFAEFWLFLRHNKKWWLLPMLLMVLLFGVLVVFSGTGAAPFIYTLF